VHKLALDCYLRWDMNQIRIGGHLCY
jgi:hypothetical protein